MEKKRVVDVEAADKESLLTPEDRRIIAEWRLKNAGDLGRNQKQSEKKPEKPIHEEKMPWLARNRPGIRRIIGTLLYNPKRQKPTQT